jgi:hypothetical protein
LEPAFVVAETAGLVGQEGSLRRGMDRLEGNLVLEGTSQEVLHTAFLDSLGPALDQHDPIVVVGKTEERSEDIEETVEDPEEQKDLEDPVVDFDVQLGLSLGQKLVLELEWEQEPAFAGVAVTAVAKAESQSKSAYISLVCDRTKSCTKLMRAL